MKENNNKKALKWLIITLSGIFICLILEIGLIVIIDPFFQYHAPLKNFPYIVDNQMNQNPGMAKNMEYDSVVVGSSMTAVFNMKDFREICGKKTVKLTHNAAFPKDISNILEIVFESHPEIETVYMGLDPLVYTYDPDLTSYEIPEYLYDNNVLNDAPYFFNKDVLIQYILKPILKTDSRTDFDYVYKPIFHESLYSADWVLQHYDRAEQSDSRNPKDSKINDTRENLEKNILPYIRNHTNTEFVIFIPPYSILYWDHLNRIGDTDAALYQYQYLIETLLKYENVRIFFFSNQEEIVTDLDHYVDYTHSHPRYGTFMVECFASGECEMTEENYMDILDDMQRLAIQFPYEELLKK